MLSAFLVACLITLQLVVVVVVIVVGVALVVVVVDGGADGECSLWNDERKRRTRAPLPLSFSLLKSRVHTNRPAAGPPCSILSYSKMSNHLFSPLLTVSAARRTARRSFLVGGVFLFKVCADTLCTGVFHSRTIGRDAPQAESFPRQIINLTEQLILQ